MKYAVDFEGWIIVEAKNRDEAQNIFLEWAGDIQDNTSIKWNKKILQYPAFQFDGVEEINKKEIKND